MSEKGNVKGKLLAAIIWIVLLGILAVATKYFILPYFKEKLEDRTGSESLYKAEIKVAADSFSGYCILRSSEMKNDLKSQGIKLSIQDDQADYGGRIKALEKKKLQMAVFTVDSFILSGARLGDFPATIVMVIDETKGADAIVSYKSSVASIQDLNHPAARIVLTPQSPSEFLARTVIAHFNLPNLPDKWWEEADGAGDVYRKFRAAGRNEKRAYVMWEPHVSKALEIDDAHLLLDSSKLKGYIVDILVVERNFLRDHPDMVRSVVEAYFRAAYSYSRNPAGMQTLVLEDAETTGAERLKKEQAESLVNSIEWKNTLENYAYFGLLTAQQSQGFQHIEDVIINITDVLIKTGAINRDPLEGKPYTIFYDKTLGQMQVDDFHPGKKLNILDGVGLDSADLERLRSASPLRNLNDEEWEALVSVGQMRVKPISFARGTARINIQSERELDDLAHKLTALPQYYLLVIGHARTEGDREANLRLAKERAEKAAAYLVEANVDINRIMVTAISSRWRPCSLPAKKARHSRFLLNCGSRRSDVEVLLSFHNMKQEGKKTKSSGSTDISIDEKKFNKKLLLSLITSPWTLWPLLAGVTDLLAVWTFNISSRFLCPEIASALPLSGRLPGSVQVLHECRQVRCFPSPC